MIDPHRNIILIGMAGSGKSSIGRRLASVLSRKFVDIDDLLEQAAGYSLQKIIETDGPAGFRLLEEKVLLELNLVNHVIATGGSSVYSRKGMRHLKRNGLIIFLEVGLQPLENRIRNFAERGLVRNPGQSFSELYRERMPLYRQYSDLIYPCGEKTEEEICDDLVHLLRHRRC